MSAFSSPLALLPTVHDDGREGREERLGWGRGWDGAEAASFLPLRPLLQLLPPLALPPPPPPAAALFFFSFFSLFSSSARFLDLDLPRMLRKGERLRERLRLRPFREDEEREA